MGEMIPNWKSFVDNLIENIRRGKTSWGKNELVEFIKDEKIKFLEKAVDPLGLDDDVPF